MAHLKNIIEHNNEATKIAQEKIQTLKEEMEAYPQESGIVSTDIVDPDSVPAADIENLKQQILQVK